MPECDRGVPKSKIDSAWASGQRKERSSARCLRRVAVVLGVLRTRKNSGKLQRVMHSSKSKVNGRCRTGTSPYGLEKKQSRLRSCSYFRFSAVPFLNTLQVFWGNTNNNSDKDRGETECAFGSSLYSKGCLRTIQNGNGGEGGIRTPYRF